MVLFLSNHLRSGLLWARSCWYRCGRAGVLTGAGQERPLRGRSTAHPASALARQPNKRRAATRAPTASGRIQQGNADQGTAAKQGVSDPLPRSASALAGWNAHRFSGWNVLATPLRQRAHRADHLIEPTGAQKPYDTVFCLRERAVAAWLVTRSDHHGTIGGISPLPRRNSFGALLEQSPPVGASFPRSSSAAAHQWPSSPGVVLRCGPR